jgi:hypothetical protein
MAFRAKPEDIASALAAQADVLRVLQEHHHPSWMESRELIKAITPAIKSSRLNFEEKKFGDLINTHMNEAMEVQHSERTDNCLWMHSKYLHCGAEWQCFSFKKHGVYLVIASKMLREYIDEWKVAPTAGNGDSYYTFGIDWLRKHGAVELLAWCEAAQ